MTFPSQYLVYDTQMVVGGRKHDIAPEEHIYGALVLYLDIIQIFLSLLSVFRSGDSKPCPTINCSNLRCLEVQD
ncbi:hypothetical protein Pcinc_018124 [Petrolisthes cinctipes]|uniref:Uncharacterized protein n=1 Tax=Petrolisthes cinctipes TaxID=88211 RepID=A0AAE1FP94_PETCI|nr:hypothetical protein Pcinc_018124 [Petrolisthes cinctipes]